MTVLVDSDILIEVSRGHDSAIVAKWMELSESDALILFSLVTAAELWAGARRSEYPKLEAFFDALVCVPADAVNRAKIIISRAQLRLSWTLWRLILFNLNLF